MNRNCLVVGCFVIASSVNANVFQKNDGSRFDRCGNNRVLKSSDIVVDEKMAAKIAEVILPSIYGDKILERKPFKVESSDCSWKVFATIHATEGVVMGGTAFLELRKADAKVLKVSQDK